MAHRDARILVTGAGGFVGRIVVQRLRATGRTVVAGLRDAGQDAQAISLGDLAIRRDFGELFHGIDAVVHCAARAHVLHDDAPDPLSAFRIVNRDATIALARAAANANVRRLVFLSSIGVHGNETRGTPFTATDTPRPHSDYAIAKWEAEQALTEIARQTGMELAVIRPPLVIGPCAKGNLAALTRAVRRGIPLPLGAVTGNRRDLISLDVLADVISIAIDHRQAPGEPLLVSDGVSRSTRAIVEELAGQSGSRARLLPMPPSLLKLALHGLGRPGLASQLLGDLEIDISATVARLDWRPRRFL